MDLPGTAKPGLFLTMLLGIAGALLARFSGGRWAGAAPPDRRIHRLRHRCQRAAVPLGVISR